MIFCVEDDSSIRELIVYTLKSTGFEAVGIGDGEELFSRLETTTPIMILLDIMLPGQDGLDILKRLKSTPATREIPVILVTAKGNEFDKVIGLDTGADDYIAKPFGMMEMVSRVKAVLRRTTKTTKEPEAILSCNGITLDVKRHTVSYEGSEIILTFKEFELLRLLMQNMGIVMTRDHLLEKIWGYDFDGETRTVDVHIRTLRQKLGNGGNGISTVRGVGYRIGAEI